MLRAYSTKAASRRWSFAAFFILLDIVALDAYVICKYLQITTTKRRHFFMELAEKLCSEEKNRSQVPQVLHLKRIRKYADKDLPLNKKTKCRICQLIKKRVKCCNCSIFVSATYSPPVFKSCFEI